MEDEKAAMARNMKERGKDGRKRWRRRVKGAIAEGGAW